MLKTTGKRKYQRKFHDVIGRSHANNDSFPRILLSLL